MDLKVGDRIKASAGGEEEEGGEEKDNAFHGLMSLVFSI